MTDTTTEPAKAATETGGAPVAGAAPAGQSPGQEGGAPAAYRPEGLPDHLAGTSERETIDRLWTAQKGYREAQARYEPPPATADAYEFTWGDTVKPYEAELKDDALLKGVREDLLAAGLGKSAANVLMNGIMSRIIGMELMAAPVDVEAEKAKLAPAEARGLAPAERDAAIQRRVGGNVAFVDGMIAKGLDAAAAKAIGAELAAFPELNAFVEHVRASAGGAQPALGGAAPQSVTRADLDKRVADPRGRVGSPQYDADYARETERQFRALYPN